ncbi:MAG: DUF692 domain-containing protein [Pseudomonadota bacterium]
MKTSKTPTKPVIGVGLRHPHFSEALSGSAAVDFVEVHSENFFAHGGALHQILNDISEKYPVSLHSTAMGLGSVADIPESYLSQLYTLTEIIQPFLLSDHACFAWGQVGDQFVHAGDLLPITYNEESLSLMTQRISQIQERLGQRLLIENLSAYLTMPGSTFSEKEFLLLLVERTQCGLLIDLNNLLVNAYNKMPSAATDNHLETTKSWLQDIPSSAVGEIHLAGYQTPSGDDMAVDDHSQPVSALGWELYAYALNLFGSIPTLIEWDNQLPDWNTLIAQAHEARSIALKVLNDE